MSIQKEKKKKKKEIKNRKYKKEIKLFFIKIDIIMYFNFTVCYLLEHYIMNDKTQVKYGWYSRNNTYGEKN